MDTNKPLPAAPVTPADPAANLPSVEAVEAAAAPKPRLEPTRYGDWELNGKCVDF